MNKVMHRALQLFFSEVCVHSAHRHSGPEKRPFFLKLAVSGVVRRRGLLKLSRFEPEKYASFPNSYVANQDYFVRYRLCETGPSPCSWLV